MSYPLYADLYEVNGAIYRRPPYRGDTTQMNQLPTGAGDTADLYDDDNFEEECGETDDGPVCGVGSIPAEPEVVEPEPAKRARTIAPPPGFGPPPGFSAPSASKPTPPVSAPRDGPRVTQEGERRWTASIEVPTNLHGLLIGQRAMKKKEMEDATQCRIIFPARDANSPIIRIVSSAGEENVARCLDRIEATVLSKQKSGVISKTLTHFASFPCTDPSVRQRFSEFQESVLASLTVDASCKVAALFPSELKLHVTICMLQLMTDQEKELALKTMAVVKDKYFGRSPLEVCIKGIDTMTDNPADTNVVFARIHGEGVQQLVDDIRDEFVNAGVGKEEKGSVKLHMTVMNTRYATARNRHGQRDWKTKKAFDATALLEEHGDFEFGTFALDRITICTLGTVDEETGYYECLTEETSG